MSQPGNTATGLIQILLDAGMSKNVVSTRVFGLQPGQRYRIHHTVTDKVFGRLRDAVNQYHAGGLDAIVCTRCGHLHGEHRRPRLRGDDKVSFPGYWVSAKCKQRSNDLNEKFLRGEEE